MTDQTPLVQPFPNPGPRLTQAYRELRLANEGTEAQAAALNASKTPLPKPWIPATCRDEKLRAELWTWLDAVVVWLNHEFVFDPVDIIPACWPKHPHVVHEVAVLADLRRRAERADDSDFLEEWYRYALPSFLDRMRHRLGGHCKDDHPPKWPSLGWFTKHLDDDHSRERARDFAADTSAVRPPNDDASPSSDTPRLRIVDGSSGEVLN